MEPAAHQKDYLYYGLVGVGAVYALLIVIAKIVKENRKYVALRYRRKSLRSVTSAELITTIAELELQEDAESRRGTLASIFSWKINNKAGRLSENWAFIPNKSDNSHPLNFLKTKKNKSDTKMTCDNPAFDAQVDDGQASEQSAHQPTFPLAYEKAPSTDSSCEDEDYLHKAPSQQIPQYCILENGVQITSKDNSKFVKPHTYLKPTQEEKKKSRLEKVADFFTGKSQTKTSISGLFQSRSSKK